MAYSTVNRRLVKKKQPRIGSGFSVGHVSAPMAIASTTQSYAAQIMPPTTAKPYVGPVQEYKGRLARYVSIKTAHIQVAANDSWPYPIDREEDGELLSFTVAVSDPEMKVICAIEGDDGSEHLIHDMTMRETAIMGRGMTLGQAESTAGQTATSMDKPGVRHGSKPYLSRYKSTFTGDAEDYEEIKGTEDDIYIVLEYDPTVKLGYKRVVLEVLNQRTEGDRHIHQLELEAMVFVSQFETRVNQRSIETTPTMTDPTIVGNDIDAHQELADIIAEEDENGEHDEEDIGFMDFNGGPPSAFSTRTIRGSAKR